MNLRYILVLFLLLPTLAFAQYKVLKQSAQSVLIEIRLQDLQESTFEINGSVYHSFRFKDGIVEDRYGYPTIPVLQTRLAVPVGAEISFQVIDGETESRRNVTIIPRGIFDFPEFDPAKIMNNEIYNVAFPYPEWDINIGQPYNYRGVNVVPLRISPIRYFPGSNEVIIQKKMRILFQFKNGPPGQSPVNFKTKDRHIFRHKIINAEQAALFTTETPVGLSKIFANYDLSLGEWYRIPVQEEGIYQISGAFLRSAGVDIDNIQMSTIQLFNYGGSALPYSVLESRPQDLNEIAVEVLDNDSDGIMDDNDWVRFYGKGLGGYVPVNINGNISWQYYGNPDGSRTLHPYDETNYYLFTFNSQTGKRIASIASPQLSNPRKPNRFWDSYHFEVDENNILSSGLDWYWLKMIGTSDKKSTTFNLPQNVTNDSVQVSFRFHGGSGSLYGTNEIFRYNLKVLLNNQIILDNILFTNNATLVRSYQNTTLNPLLGGINQLEIQHIGNLEGCEVYLDNFDVSGLVMPFDFIYSLAVIKRCAAITNKELGLLAMDIANAIDKLNCIF